MGSTLIISMWSEEENVKESFNNFAVLIFVHLQQFLQILNMVYFSFNFFMIPFSFFVLYLFGHMREKSFLLFTVVLVFTGYFDFNR